MFFVVLTWATALLVALPDPASAETVQAPRTVVVLPVTRGDERLDELRRRAAELEDELSAHGLQAVPHGSAALLFEDRHSREPRHIQPADVEMLLRESELARRAAAARENAEAKRYAERVQKLVADRLERANRDDAVARAYFAACWAHVRALVNEDDHAGALTVARRCAADVPDLEPRLRDHPPSVMRIFEALKRELAGERAATLDIESAPPGCRVLIDGRAAGTTPTRQRVPLDQRYAVQVDCGGDVPPRVHDVIAQQKPVVIVVDAIFERAVRTSDGVLRLSYAQVDDPSTAMHARAVAHALDVDEVVLLSAADHGALRMQRLGHPSITVSDARRAGVLAESAATLVRGQAEPTNSAAAAPAPARPPAPTPLPARAARWLVPAGLVFAGAGVSLLAAGAVRFRQHLDDAEAFHVNEIISEYKPLGQRWQDSRTMPFTLFGVGSGLLTVSGVLLTEPVPPKTRRWLSPLLLSAGIGVATVGLRNVVNGSPCARLNHDEETCVNEESQLDRGALITIAAAPLLIVPIVHLAEWLVRGSDATRQVALQISEREVRATLRF